MRILLCLTIFAALAASAFAADDPATPAPSARPAVDESTARPAIEDADFNLHFDFVIVALPQAEALPLIEAMKDPAQMESAYTSVLKLITDHKADLVGMLTSIIRPGLRTTAEDVEEIRYGTTYQAGQIAQILPEPPKETVPVPPPGPAKAEEKPKAPAEPAEPRVEKIAAIVDSLETKNVGIVLELEADFDPKTQHIPLSYSASHSVFNGMAKVSVVIDGATSFVEQPKILSNRAQSQLDLVSGRRVLLGTFRAPAKEGWMELFLLRATARPVK